MNDDMKQAMIINHELPPYNIADCGHYYMSHQIPDTDKTQQQYENL